MKHATIELDESATILMGLGMLAGSLRKPGAAEHWRLIVSMLRAGTLPSDHMAALRDQLSKVLRESGVETLQ